MVARETRGVAAGPGRPRRYENGALDVTGPEATDPRRIAAISPAIRSAPSPPCAKPSRGVRVAQSGHGRSVGVRLVVSTYPSIARGEMDVVSDRAR